MMITRTTVCMHCNKTMGTQIVEVKPLDFDPTDDCVDLDECPTCLKSIEKEMEQATMVYNQEYEEHMHNVLYPNPSIVKMEELVDDSSKSITKNGYTLAYPDWRGFTITKGDNTITIIKRSGNMLDDFGEENNDYYLRVNNLFDNLLIFSALPSLNPNTKYIWDTGYEYLEIFKVISFKNGNWVNEQVVDCKPEGEILNDNEYAVMSAYIELN